MSILQNYFIEERFTLSSPDINPWMDDAGSLHANTAVINTFHPLSKGFRQIPWKIFGV